MPDNGPYSERSGAIVDRNGRIEIPAYERRGEEFRGDNPHLVDDPVICPLFMPVTARDEFLFWMQKLKLDVFCLTSSGPNQHQRMDRHWSSEYCQIEDMFRSSMNTQWVAVGFSDPERHAEARQQFGSLKLDTKIETPTFHWGNSYVSG